MKLHWRTRNRLVALKYRLLAPYHALRQWWRARQCRKYGHEEFPDCGAVYCTRCCEWLSFPSDKDEDDAV